MYLNMLGKYCEMACVKRQNCECVRIEVDFNASLLEIIYKNLLSEFDSVESHLGAAVFPNICNRG